MRIVIVTAGSRGDVAPFTGLGQRLRAAGHDVALAAHDRFSGLVRDAGLEHRTLPGDPVELTRARTAAPTPEAARSVFATFLDELGDGVLDAAAGAEVLLSAFGPAPVARVVADGLGIPSAGVFLAPGVATREIPLAAPDVLARSGALYAPVLRRLRSRLGLRGPGATADPPPDWPVLHGYSGAVVPRPADWPASAQVSGYWWPAVPPGWEPPGDLVEFLDAGPPPVFVGFGSMTAEHGRLREVVATAVRRAGVRAVVQSGWAGLAPDGDDVLVVGDVPHEWLFGRVAAVVHHAGAGTTGAGLRAGVPAVAVPVLLDQPFWAERLHHLGVAPRPLPFAELTADALAAALRSCLGPSYRDRAAALGARIRTEDGAHAVLATVARLGSAAPQT